MERPRDTVILRVYSQLPTLPVFALVGTYWLLVVGYWLLVLNLDCT